MSIPDMSFKERVNFTAVMEKANYPKGLEGSSRWWNPACIVSFPLAAVSSLTRGALLCLGLCTLVASGTICTGMEIARAMAMCLLRNCFDDSTDGDSQDVAVAYLFMVLAAQWRFELWMKVMHNQGNRDANATGFPPRLALTALDDANTVGNAHLPRRLERLAKRVIAISREKHQYIKTRADGDLLNNPSLLTSMPTIDDGRVRLEV